MENDTASKNKKQICRLCAMEHENGTSDQNDLVHSIYGYLGIEYLDDGLLPNCWLCAPCIMEAESTDKFLKLVKEGQEKLKLAKLLDSSEDWLEEESETSKVPLRKKRGRKPGLKAKHLKNTSQAKVEVAALTFPTSINMLERSTRLRRLPKRYMDDVMDLSGSNDLISYDANSCALITTEPIAELRSSAGISLAEVIELEAPSSSSAANSHTKMHLICEYCKEIFPTQKRFLAHIETHQNCSYECTQCLRNFRSKHDFEQHQKEEQHTGMGIVEKMEPFKSDTIAENEIINNVTAINIVVGTNGQITSIDSNSTKDETKSGGSFDIESSKENGSMAKQMERNVLKSKSSNSTYACLKCSKTFENPYAVRRHYKQVHIAARIYKCQLCVASFKNKSNYDYHLAHHTNRKPFKCDVCEKCFILKYELTVHRRVHTRERPYVCDLCNKTFSHRCNLVVHQRLHSGMHPYKCETCNASFNSSSHLRRHKEMHLKQAENRINQKLTDEALQQTLSPPSPDELYFPVEIIEIENFHTPPTKANSLLKTNRLATALPMTQVNNCTDNSTQGEYKFQCPTCFKYFKQRSTLSKHARTHSGEKPYKCPHCPKAFADPSNFKKHKMLHKNATNELKHVRPKPFSGARRMQQMGLSSPTHSVASDPDPDGVETALLRVNAFAETSAASSDFDHCHVLKVDQSALPPSGGNCLLLEEYNDPEASLDQLSAAQLPNNQLVCISYQDPTTNPVDNKTTTFYVVN